jgi:two-component system OmpR family response regulator
VTLAVPSDRTEILIHLAKEGDTPMLNFHKTLLLVDDDIVQLELRAQVLRVWGFTVMTADSPVAAISTMAQHRPDQVDLAVLDYKMPGMNGCVLADYLRSRYPDLKIILHSASVDILEDEMCSIDAFIPKC